MVKIPSPEELNALNALETITHEGEALEKLPHHPGRTRRLVSWINSLANVSARYYGPQSEISRRVSQLDFFPFWPLVDNIHAGDILTPLPDDDPRLLDRREAYRTFKSGIADALGLLDSMRQDIEINGLPRQLPPDASQSLINFQPTISQLQTQSQEQAVTMEHRIRQTVRLVRDHYGEQEATRAQEMLNELHQHPDRFGSVKKVASYFLDLGREAFLAVLPTLTQILSGH